jgi:hypothetical protein
MSAKIYCLKELDASFPDKMRKFLFAGESMMEKAKKWDEQIKLGKVNKPFEQSQVNILLTQVYAFV